MNVDGICHTIRAKDWGGIAGICMAVCHPHNPGELRKKPGFTSGGVITAYVSDTSFRLNTGDRDHGRQMHDAEHSASSGGHI